MLRREHTFYGHDHGTHNSGVGSFLHALGLAAVIATLSVGIVIAIDVTRPEMDTEKLDNLALQDMLAVSQDTWDVADHGDQLRLREVLDTDGTPFEEASMATIPKQSSGHFSLVCALGSDSTITLLHAYQKRGTFAYRPIVEADPYYLNEVKDRCRTAIESLSIQRDASVGR